MPEDSSSMDWLLQASLYGVYRISCFSAETSRQIDSEMKTLESRCGYRERSAQHSVAEAIHHVVVYHPHGLHEGVADGRSHKVEAALLKIFADRIGVGGSCGDLLEGLKRGLSWLAVDEPPQVAVEAAKFSLHFQESLCGG